MPTSAQPELILSGQIDAIHAAYPQGYMTTVDGKRVSVDSPDVVGCLADQFFLAKELNERGAVYQSNIISRATSEADKVKIRGGALYSVPKIRQNQNIAQVARYYAFLAAACDKYRVAPVDVMGPIAKAAGAKRGYLCDVEYYDTITGRSMGSTTLKTPQDMLTESDKINKAYAAIQAKSPDIYLLPTTQKGTSVLRGMSASRYDLSQDPQGGMGFIPLLLAIPYMGYIIAGLVLAAIATVAYGIKKVVEAWTSDDSTTNKEMVKNYECYHKYSELYAQAKTPEEAEKYKTIMLTCSDNANALRTDLLIGRIFKMALVGAVAYGGYKIYMNRQAQKQTERVANGKTYDAEYSMSDSGIYLPR